MPHVSQLREGLTDFAASDEFLKPDRLDEVDPQLALDVGPPLAPRARRGPAATRTAAAEDPTEQVAQSLKEIHDNNPDKTVVVKGDRRLKYKDVRKVMRLINEAGFTRVGLVIDKKQGKA